MFARPARGGEFFPPKSATGGAGTALIFPCLEGSCLVLIYRMHGMRARLKAGSGLSALGTIFAMLFSQQVCQAGVTPLDYWTWQNPQVSGVNLYSIAEGNGTYVATGNWGAALTSSDGTDWQNKSLPISLSLARLAFGNGVFV